MLGVWLCCALTGTGSQLLAGTGGVQRSWLRILVKASPDILVCVLAGFLAAILVEAATGRGIIGQCVEYVKLSGALGPQSGF